jgi:hypothetical protein
MPDLQKEIVIGLIGYLGGATRNAVQKAGE